MLPVCLYFHYCPCQIFGTLYESLLSRVRSGGPLVRYDILNVCF